MNLTNVAEKLAGMVVKAHSIIGDLRFDLKKARIRKRNMQARLDVAEKALRQIKNHKREMWDSHFDDKIEYEMIADSALHKLKNIKRSGLNSGSSFERTLAKELTSDL